MTKMISVSDPTGAATRGKEWDAVLVVAPDVGAVDLPGVGEAVASAKAVDARVGEDVTLLPLDTVAGGRLVLAPTGPLDRDQDDVRRFADAASAAVRRARDAGSRRPLLVIAGIPSRTEYSHAVPVGAISALGALWQPLEAREALGAGTVEPVEKVGLASFGHRPDDRLAAWVDAVDGGLRVARDLCGTEPERMAPPRFAEYCEHAFAGLPVALSIVSDDRAICEDYPLLAAVARASMGVERHRPNVVRMEYTGEGPIERTILLAGKGVTYDTGGADLKAGGVMAGMSRDKGGAAAVAGFVHAVARLGLHGVRVIAELGVVRNSIGADCYVTDEILKSHARVRVRVGNTDAEGRMVLADLLSHLRVRAVGERSPRILSVATLTGHSARAVGPYSIALDNSPARAIGVAESLSAQGDLWGDPFDVSRLRREDWDFVKPRSKADDVLSCNSAPSTATARGHQFPMAFLAIASGLAEHGRNSDRPLAFTHVDIGGSAMEGGDWQHGRPTGRPVVAMLAALVEGMEPN